MTDLITNRDDEFRQTITFYFTKNLGHPPNADQMAAYLAWCRAGATGEQIDAKLAAEPEAIARRTQPTPAHGALSQIHVDGFRFLDAAGVEFIWAMLSGFRDYERFLRGEDIRPLLQETVDVGGTGRRVFGAFDFGTPDQQRLYPFERVEYYDRLPEFFGLNADYGLRVEFTVFADSVRSVPGGASAQRDHFQHVSSVLATIPNAFLEFVNEQDAHDNRPAFEPEKPAGVICSRGSNGEGSNPPAPNWDYACLHSERKGDFALSSTTLYFAITGYAGENGTPGYSGTRILTVNNEPPGFADVSVPGRRTNDPRIAYLMGLGCRFGQGGTAHSDCGLQSVLLSPVQRACVEAFIRGVKG